MLTNKPKVLVVEDELDIRELMVLHLAREGYDVRAVEDGEQALQLVQDSKNKYDVLVVDWMLPGLSGLDLVKRVVQQLPEQERPSILMVTARANTADVVLGLELGADDYMTKPFEIPVLIARVRALLRRNRLEVSVKDGKVEIKIEVVEHESIRVDEASHQAYVNNKAVHLTPSEYKLLVALLKNRGRVLSREALIRLVQGDEVFVIDRAVDTHVFGLRKKLGTAGEFIETVRGIGYRVHNI